MGYNSGGHGPGYEGAVDDCAEEDRGKDHEREGLEEGFDDGSVRETTAPKNEILAHRVFDIKSRLIGLDRATASTCGRGFETEVFGSHNDLCFLVIESSVESGVNDCCFCPRSNLDVAFASDDGWLCHLLALKCRFSNEEIDGHEEGDQDTEADDVEVLDT